MGQYWRLRDAQGKPPGVMGWWPSRSVTFLDNHDTGSTQVIMSHKYIFYALRFINRVHMFAYFFFWLLSQAHWPFPSHHIMEVKKFSKKTQSLPCVSSFP